MKRLAQLYGMIFTIIFATTGQLLNLERRTRALSEERRFHTKALALGTRHRT
jgi:hypothetical protein